MSDYEAVGEQIGDVPLGLYREHTASGDGGMSNAPADDPFGGHEFAYESHTDLFRCIHCHSYEVVVRKEGLGIEPCAGQPPASSGPIEVNAW